MSTASPHWLEPTASSLIGQLRQEQLGHAPLIQGPAGVGKKWLANVLAGALLCTEPQASGGNACGRCHACQLHQNGTHPDYFFVEPPEPGRQILVDQVRELVDQLVLTPSIGRYRLGLIAPAENMNDSAANALLKTLEEPPDNVWLILVSHSPQRLLPTIRSRCQKVPIGPPSRSIGMAWLQEQQPDCSERACDLALRMSSGAPLLAFEKLSLGHVEAADLVLDQLHQLAMGECAALGLADRWANEQASIIWPLLAFWISELSLAPHESMADHRLKNLSHKAASNDWAFLWSGALEAIASLGTGRRQDLLMSAWLLEWADSFKN
ncbi:MAG TPA: DNA polymerase III subunit delta' [Wenzhouxiangella sp.]